ncbi:MAG: glycosyltransferase family 2 protein [Planctomycetota bacterium]
MSSEAAPLVSALVCTYNGGEYLRASIGSLLAQTHESLEVIVVDDGSTDGSVDPIEAENDPRVQVLRQENAGKSVAMNYGLSVAKGEFYFLHDADDLSYPRRVERQLARLQEKPELAGVFCGYDLVVGERQLAPRFRPKTVAECADDIEGLRMPGHDPTIMFRRALVDDFEYCPELRVGQGFDHILRVGEKHPLEVLGECLYSYRVHPESNTRKDPSRRERFVQMVRARAFERRGIESEAATTPQRVSKDRADNGLAAHFMESVTDLRGDGRRWEAIRTGLYCSKLGLLDFHYQKAFLCAVLPKSILAKLRGTN